MFTRLDALDRRISQTLLVKLRADGTPRRWVFLLRRFSETGSYGLGWIALFAVAAAVSAGLEAGIVAAACVVGMLGANTIIKKLIRRPRPQLRAIDHAPSSYSMPSAHTSMAMVGAATMSVMLPELTAFWWVIAVALSVSRVLLGMHFFADVLVGAIVGIAVGLLIAAPLVSSFAS